MAKKFIIKTLVLLTVPFFIFSYSIALISVIKETRVDIPNSIISSALSQKGDFLFALVKEEGNYFFNKYDTCMGYKVHSILIGGIDEELIKGITIKPINTPDAFIDPSFSDINHTNLDALFTIKISKHDQFVVLNKRNCICIYTLDLCPVAENITPNFGTQITAFDISDELNQLAYTEPDGHGTVIKIPTAGKQATSVITHFDINAKTNGPARSVHFTSTGTLFIETLKCMLELDISRNLLIVAKQFGGNNMLCGFDYGHRSEEIFIDTSSEFRTYVKGRISGYPIKIAVNQRSPEHRTTNILTDIYTMPETLELSADLKNFKIEGNAVVTGQPLQVLGLYDTENQVVPMKFYFSSFLRLLKSRMLPNALLILVKDKRSNSHFLVQILFADIYSLERTIILQRGAAPLLLEKRPDLEHFALIFK